MNKFFLFFLSVSILLSSIASLAQNDYKTISGYVLDKETNEPIVFASIYLKGQGIGTTSNNEGYFRFHIPSHREVNTIVISIIGYESLEKNANDFIANQNIYLNSTTTSLDEVVITSTKEKELTAKQIIKKAYQEIKNNYPSEPYILEGFVRDLQKEDEAYVAYLECATKFLYKGITTRKEPEVELLAVRTNYLAPQHPWNENSERKNSIIDLVEDEFIRFDYGPIKGKSSWKYEIEDIVPYQNGMVYQIEGTDKPFQNATLYIDTETFAFIKIELTRQPKNNRYWRDRFTNGAQQASYHVIFEYQEYKGKMYLKYQKEEDAWIIYDGLTSKKVLFTKYPKKELFINKIITDNVASYPFKRNMDISASIENQSETDHPDFWNSYNIPQQTEAQSKILKELKNRTD
ncbi:carboxypeptidase-like regulatory domain-containing protein [Dokdonia ponticola]|uniref:Carboxypeptidase-like regulatory domain-containing protein n=1 Tax=Dokdonia ponticola TaxID=2041041 RepID=A0ABV9HWG9_9FLAO